MSQFNYENVDHRLEVVDRSATTFRSEHYFDMKAREPSRFFIREYGWTGSGMASEQVPELVTGIDKWGFPLQRVHGPVVIENNLRILVIDLGRTISKGERVEVRFKHKMKDLSNTFQSRLSFAPSRKIRGTLKLSVSLPDWKQLRVMYQKFTHDTQKIVDSTQIEPEVPTSGRLIFVKEIVKPSAENMGHKLVWSYDDG